MQENDRNEIFDDGKSENECEPAQTRDDWGSIDGQGIENPNETLEIEREKEENRKIEKENNDER